MIAAARSSRRAAGAGRAEPASVASSERASLPKDAAVASPAIGIAFFA
jgi:hypothetical protein